MPRTATRLRHRRWSAAHSVLVAACLAGAVGCTAGDDGAAGRPVTTSGRPTGSTPATSPAGTVPAAPVSELLVAARDDGGTNRFDAPDRVYAGDVPLTFTNDGGGPHQLLLLRPKASSSAAQVAEALGGPAPISVLAFADLVGGAGVLSSGGRQEAVVRLEPGSYFLASLVPGPDGASEARKGLFRPLAVVPEERPRPDDPGNDPAGTLRLSGGTVEAPRSLAGPTWFDVVNKEPDPVGLAVLELEEGATPEDAAVWMDNALATIPAPDPPFTWIGGVGPLPPGGTARMHLDQSRGRFLLAPVQPGITGLFLPATTAGRATLLQSA